MFTACLRSMRRAGGRCLKLSVRILPTAQMPVALQPGPDPDRKPHLQIQYSSVRASVPPA